MTVSAEMILLGVLEGAVLASLFNHALSASTQGGTVFSSIPTCESCGTAQPQRRRIPILATLFRWRTCSQCGSTSPQLFGLMELMLFGISTWSFMVMPPGKAIQMSILAFSLIGVVYMDFRQWIIPNVFVVGVLLVALLGLITGTVRIGESGAGFLVASLVSLMIILPQRFGSGDKTMALGDVKLNLAVALWLGGILASYVFFLASVLATLAWILNGILKGFSSQRRVPFGPFVAFSTLIFGIARLIDPQFVTHLLSYRF